LADDLLGGPRLGSRRDLFRESAALQRPADGVEHQRDAGQRLDRPVVEKERQPAALLLLGGHELPRESLAVGHERFQTDLGHFVTSALADDQVQGEARGGGDRSAEPGEREPRSPESKPHHCQDRRNRDGSDEQPGPSR